MARTSKRPEYMLRINLQSGTDLRRFSQVRVDGKDNVYILQPRKETSVHVSYHESGERHLKVGDGPSLFVMHLDKPEWIRSEEPVWEKSFENFATLLPYTGQHADQIVTVPLPELPYGDCITFAQVSIGRFFEPQILSTDGVTLITLLQETYAVPISPSGLHLCVRVLNLASAAP